MSIFEDAKIDFKKNNYLRSAELFQKAIKSDDLSLQDQAFAWEKIRLIHQNLNKKLSLSALIAMAKVNEEVKDFDKASEVFFELYKETKELFYLNEAYNNTSLSGDMIGAKKIARKYIEQLIRERRSDEIFQFLNNNEARFDGAETLLWKANAYLISGNRDAFIELYNDTQTPHQKNFLLQEYVKYAERKTHYWQSDKGLLGIVFDRLADKQVRIILSKKQVAKLILNIWMEKAIERDLIVSTVRIADKYQLNFIGVAIAQYMEDVELEKMFKERLPEDILLEQVDLGEDLFADEESNSEGEESVIVRNIELLKSLGKESDLERELNKLKKINPDHELILTVDDEVGLNAESVFNDLMSEFSQYTMDTDEEKIEDAYSKLANFYDWEYVQENYEDMIVGLNLLSLSNVALDVANMVNKEMLTQEEVINLEYLKLETMMILQKYFSVRDGVDDMISNFPIKGSELLSLLYLRAEAFMSLKQYENARHAFKEISGLKKNYRNTRQRLEELEKHK